MSCSPFAISFSAWCVSNLSFFQFFLCCIGLFFCLSRFNFVWILTLQFRFDTSSVSTTSLRTSPVFFISLHSSRAQSTAVNGDIQRKREREWERKKRKLKKTGKTERENNTSRKRERRERKKSRARTPAAGDKAETENGIRKERDCETERETERPTEAGAIK